MSDTTALEGLLGPKLLTGENDKTSDTSKLLKNKKIIGLYFSASWCPPCKTFSPLLSDFYKHVKDEVEIIYVSSDRTREDFDAYYGKMPWLALPNDEEGGKRKVELAKIMKIQGIPTLIILDSNGLVITNDGRTHVQSAATTAAAAKQVVSRWKSTPAVPLEEGLRQSVGGILQRMLMTILKNPIYIFAMLYLIKWVYRKYTASQNGPAAVAMEQDEAPIPDDEF